LLLLSLQHGALLLLRTRKRKRTQKRKRTLHGTTLLSGQLPLTPTPAAGAQEVKGHPRVTTAHRFRQGWCCFCVVHFCLADSAPCICLAASAF
jgi:hypothetical protein